MPNTSEKWTAEGREGNNWAGLRKILDAPFAARVGMLWALVGILTSGVLWSMGSEHAEKVVTILTLPIYILMWGLALVLGEAAILFYYAGILLMYFCVGYIVGLIIRGIMSPGFMRNIMVAVTATIVPLAAIILLQRL